MEVARPAGYSLTFRNRGRTKHIENETRAFLPRNRKSQAASRPHSNGIAAGELRWNDDRKRGALVCKRYASDYGMVSSDAEGSVSKKIPVIQDHPQSVLAELTMLSLPAVAGQAIEPLAQLMETAYIGRLGTLELASVGVSVSIFNIVSKVLNIPLLSVTTSFVAEDISINPSKGFSEAGNLEQDSIGNPLDEMSARKLLHSVPTALFLAVSIGVFEGLTLYLGSGLFIRMMGISPVSSMHIVARRFLALRAVGAPAVVVSMAIQGIFRGFKDTKTPVLCLGLGNLSAVILFPLLMYSFGLGLYGAAISTVASQYIVTCLMIWYLSKKTILSLPNVEDFQFGGYLKSGGFLIGRTVAAVLTVTFSTSMAAQQGPLAMAAHQICLQVWLAVSLLSDAQASSGQALIASSLAKQEYSRVKEIVYCALKTGLFTGVTLAIVLALLFGSLATLFTNDAAVLGIIRSVAIFVSLSQPANALAYIFDGLHYGISDFSYAAWSMMISGALSSVFLLSISPMIGLSGVWFSLAVFMGLRTVAGFARLLAKSGPWFFLHEGIQRVEVAIGTSTLC